MERARPAARRSEPRAVIALYDVYILHCGARHLQPRRPSGGARWVARKAIAEDIETFAYKAPIAAASAAVAKLPGPSPLSLFPLHRSNSRFLFSPFFFAASDGQKDQELIAAVGANT